MKGTRTDWGAKGVLPNPHPFVKFNDKGPWFIPLPGETATRFSRRRRFK